LTNTINVTITINVSDCDAISSIKYRTNSSSYQKSFTDAEYICIGNLLTLNNLPVEPATNSNEFTIVYRSANLNPICNNMFGFFGTTTGFFGIIIVFAAVGFLLALLFVGIVAIQRESTGTEGDTGMGTFAGIIVFLFLIGLVLFVFAIAISQLCLVS
jgi:hypothetical protein